jgi:bloom syndrome protein
MSTILTSPISGPSRGNKSKGKGRQIDEGSDEVDFTSEDESEDAFEPAPARLRQNRRSEPLGAPITTDSHMEDLPDLHQVSVHQFVTEAKKHDEKIRNQRGVHRKSYFTELEFREMAINWTLTLNDMIQSGIEEH